MADLSRRTAKQSSDPFQDLTPSDCRLPQERGPSNSSSSSSAQTRFQKGVSNRYLAFSEPFPTVPKDGALRVINIDNPGYVELDPWQIRRDMGTYWRSSECNSTKSLYVPLGNESSDHPISSERRSISSWGSENPQDRPPSVEFPTSDADSSDPADEFDVAAEPPAQHHWVPGATLRLVSDPNSKIRPSSSSELDALRAAKSLRAPTESDPLPNQDSCERPDPRQPFKKWVSSLRRKTLQKGHEAVPTIARELIEDADPNPLASRDSRSRHKKSSSLSSMAFVTAIKSASVSLASAALPLKLTKVRPPSQRRIGQRSSRSEDRDTRISVESVLYRHANLDEGTVRRAIQRRRILEELLSSEESYIGDMKVLVTVYHTLLASVPTLTETTRSSIQRNMLEILQLHEDLLGELHRVIPNSEYSEEISARPPGVGNAHIRFGNVDGTSDAGRPRMSSCISAMTYDSIEDYVGLTATPQTVRDVAKVFTNMMNRFFSYEEYGAKYDMMVRDVAKSYKHMPAWRAYEKGIEALANSVTSINTREAQSHKGLTFGDLLIKPIQRVCKYPLLFGDLTKQTPVCDCPQAHAEIQKVLYRMRETTREINKATDDPGTRTRFAKTWMLQDKLQFDDPARATHAVAVRLLGHALLCGVLHVAWQTATGVQGDFMLCALFRSYFVLAIPDKHASTFHVVACISLENVRLEPADSGKGLQCHTALYSWKVVFESDSRLFEILLSACSSQEEEIWKQHLEDRAIAEDVDENMREGSSAADVLSFLALDMKPIGNIFGQRGTLARRLSIHRAITLSPKPGICQVIIKNTHSLIDGQEPAHASPGSVYRSHSVLSTSRIPILAPRRVERIRLESLLSDVWTTEVLPFPGMSAKKGDRPIKVSASSIIRKLSMASFTSNFSKRSPSMASVNPQQYPNLTLARRLDDADMDEEQLFARFASEPANSESSGSLKSHHKQAYYPHPHQRQYSQTMRSIKRTVSPSKLTHNFKRSTSVLLPSSSPRKKKSFGAIGFTNESMKGDENASIGSDTVRIGHEGHEHRPMLTQSHKSSVHSFVKWFGY